MSKKNAKILMLVEGAKTDVRLALCYLQKNIKTKSRSM